MTTNIGMSGLIVMLGLPGLAAAPATLFFAAATAAVLMTGMN